MPVTFRLSRAITRGEGCVSKQEVAGRDPDNLDSGEELARRAAAREVRPGQSSSISTTHRCTPSSATGCGAPMKQRISQPTSSSCVRQRVDYRGVPIQAWLFGIARNLARDHIKKQARRGYHEEITEAVTRPEDPETAVVDMRQDIAAAMGSLTGDQQMVLWLRFLLDKSVNETAALMDRSEDAVKNLQRRALAAMQRALADVGYGRSTP